MTKVEERNRPTRERLEAVTTPRRLHVLPRPNGANGRSLLDRTVRFVISAVALIGLALGLVFGPLSPSGLPMPISTAPGPWVLKLNSDFSGHKLNTSFWNSGWFGTGISGPMKDSCVSSANARVSGGSLRLRFEPGPSRCGGQSRPWLGALVSTNPHDGVAHHPGFQFTYGYAEARINFPQAPSSAIANWPAWWINGQHWPTDGEIDIAEGLYGRACIHFHHQGGSTGDCIPGAWAGGWHTYGVNWQPGSISWFYDGIKVASMNKNVTSSPMYLLLDNVQGTHGGSTLAPSTMLVDYVRVWQHS